MSRPDQVVVVTGANSGFGRLISETLAREGYRVFATMRELHGRNAGAGAELRELAGRRGAALEVLELDVTLDASVDGAVREILARAGRVDVLVNNAGFGYGGLTETFTLDQTRRIFDTNVFGAMRTIRAVLPAMHRQGGGLLLQISSGAGRVVIPGMGLYCASKFALEALTEAFHYELAPQGIDCLSIAPGAYPTGIAEKIAAGDDRDRAAAYGPVREVPERVIRTVASSTANPQEIADQVLEVIRTPAGQRALRYRVGKGAVGVETINGVCAEVQQQALAALGVSEQVRFRGRGERFTSRPS
jgi:NAD(P)-dependent dehydrogenase (short-subunit alcohol dehydrogenase family)